MSSESGNPNVHEEIGRIVAEWHGRAAVVQNAHYEAGNLYERRYLMLGAVVIVLSALVGGAEVMIPIEVLGMEPEQVKRASGFVSLIVAIFAGLQTFLKLSQRAERHRVAGARYGESKRTLEELRIALAESDERAKEALHEVKKSVDAIASESPELPAAIVKRYRIEEL